MRSEGGAFRVYKVRRRKEQSIESQNFYFVWYIVIRRARRSQEEGGLVYGVTMSSLRGSSKDGL